MSDQPTATPSNTTAKPSASSKPTPARTRKAKGYTVQDVARAYLKARGVSAPNEARILKASKTVRGIIRAHKSTLAKSDPAIKRHTKGADYGTLNKRTLDRVVKNRWNENE